MNGAGDTIDGTGAGVVIDGTGLPPATIGLRVRRSNVTIRGLADLMKHWRSADADAQASRSLLAALDEKEGHPDRYLRAPRSVRLDDDRRVAVALLLAGRRRE